MYPPSRHEHVPLWGAQHPCWEQRAEGKGLRTADFLGSRSQSPLFPPITGRLGGIFNADVVLSTSARKPMSLQSLCCSLAIPRHHGQVSTHSAKFAICFTASTAPGSGSSSMKKFLDSQMLMAFSCEKKVSSYCTGLTCPPFARTEDGDGESSGSTGSSPLLLISLASGGASAPPRHPTPIPYNINGRCSGTVLALPAQPWTQRKQHVPSRQNHRRRSRAEPNPSSGSGGALPWGSS